MSKLDLLLHPIRLRILTTLGGRELTPGQIAEIISDVPQTTLYRHINALVDGGILRVAAERQVRGTVEKAYALNDGAGRVSPQEMSGLSKDDHLRYFMIYLTSLLQDFSVYLDQRDSAQLPADGMVYNKVSLILSDAEYAALTDQMRQLVLSALGGADDGTRKTYTFGLVSIPNE